MQLCFVDNYKKVEIEKITQLKAQYKIYVGQRYHI